MNWQRRTHHQQSGEDRQVVRPDQVTDMGLVPDDPQPGHPRVCDQERVDDPCHRPRRRPSSDVVRDLHDLVGTLVTWSLGPLLLNGNRARPLQLLRQLLNTPVVQAVVVGAPLLASPWREPMVQALWWAARLVSG